MKTHAEKLAARDKAVQYALNEVWIDDDMSENSDAQKFQLELIKLGFLVVPL